MQDVGIRAARDDVFASAAIDPVAPAAGFNQVVAAAAGVEDVVAAAAGDVVVAGAVVQGVGAVGFEGRANDDVVECVVAVLVAGLIGVGVDRLEVAFDVESGLRVVLGRCVTVDNPQVATRLVIALHNNLTINEEGGVVGKRVQVLAVSTLVNLVVAILRATGQRGSVNQNAAFSAVVQNRVEPVSSLEHIAVIARAAQQHVVAFASHENVVACIAHQQVGHVAADQGIAATATQHEGAPVQAVGGRQAAGAGLHVPVAQIGQHGLDQLALCGGEGRLQQVVLEIGLKAFGVFQIQFVAALKCAGELGGDIGQVELDAAGDIAEQVLVLVGGVGGVFVVHLHGEGNQGFADFVELRVAWIPVRQGQAAVLGELPQVGGEAGEHGVGGKRALDTGFVAHEVIDQVVVVGVVSAIGKQFCVKNHPHQIRQLGGKLIERFAAGCAVPALQKRCQQGLRVQGIGSRRAWRCVGDLVGCRADVFGQGRQKFTLNDDVAHQSGVGNQRG